MANPQHVEWLLEGVWPWNVRRAREDFLPDFEDADIFEEFRSKGKLDKDGDIPLSKINLKGANLRDTNLSRADLGNAKLENADLSRARLTSRLPPQS